MTGRIRMIIIMICLLYSQPQDLLENQTWFSLSNSTTRPMHALSLTIIVIKTRVKLGIMRVVVFIRRETFISPKTTPPKECDWLLQSQVQTVFSSDIFLWIIIMIPRWSSCQRLNRRPYRDQLKMMMMMMYSSFLLLLSQMRRLAFESAVKQLKS